MSLYNSPDIFQEKILELLAGLDMVRVYIENILYLTKGSFDDHIEILEIFLHN